VLATVLIQMVVYGPLLAVCAVAGWRALRPALAADPEQAQARRNLRFFISAFVLPAALTVLVLSGRGSNLPHWTAYLWWVVTPVAAWGALQLAVQRPRVLKGLMALQALCVALMVALLLWGGPVAEEGPQRKALPGERLQRLVNPVTDLYGWRQAATDAQALAQVHGVEKLAVMNWSLGSRMAWYARPMPLNLVQNRFDQFALWFGTLQPGDSAIVIDFSHSTAAPPVGEGRFAACSLLGQTPVWHFGRQLSHFSHQLCRGWGQWSPDSGASKAEQGPSGPRLWRDPVSGLLRPVPGVPPP
jgi:hypothetical protein